MTPTAKKLLERMESWSEEDQRELAEVAREIEACRAGVYTPTPDEEKAIREGLAQLERGEFLSEEGMQPFWKALRRSMKVRYAHDLESAAR